MYRGADKSLARPTSRYILFDGENISFDASLVIYIYKTYISIYISTIYIYMGARGGVVVKALRYKPEGREFDSR
jgi:hypothetical protein